MTNDELLLAISDMMDKKLDARLKPLESNLQFVKDDVQLVKGELQLVKDDMQLVKGELHQMKLYQENVIMPRLQNIETCYTDTYRRYQSGTEQIEAMQTDIDVIKGVVREHSDKLQKIS